VRRPHVRVSTLILVAVFAGALVLYLAYRPKPASSSPGVVHPHVLPTTGSGMRSPGRASGALLATWAPSAPRLAPPTTRAARTPHPVPTAAPARFSPLRTSRRSRLCRRSRPPRCSWRRCTPG
jgi:hypothetical protein